MAISWQIQRLVEYVRWTTYLPTADELPGASYLHRDQYPPM